MVKKKTISSAQARLLQLLREGYVIYEGRGQDQHSLSYTVAQIDSRHPHALHLPKRVHKETVFALLACGLVKSVRPWEGYDSEILVLNEDQPLFNDHLGDKE